MNTRSRLLKVGVRTLTGLIVLAAAATSLLFLYTQQLPEMTRQPLKLVAHTTHQAQHTLVCPGSFTELGGDLSRPGTPIPTGTPSLVVSGTPAKTSNLTRSEGGSGLPEVYLSSSHDPVGAAQLQRLATEQLRGVTTSVCVEPLNEQWLVGGSTELGVSTVLLLGNPGEVPATVQLTIFDEKGQIDSQKTAGVIVQPGSQQTISINGYAPERKRLALRVTSTGAPVAASLVVAQTEVLDPFAVAAVTRQQQPSTQLVIPGVINAHSDRDHAGHGDVGEADQFGVIVRVLGTGDTPGSAQVRAIDANGKATTLGEIPLKHSKVGELHVKHWPKNANAVVVNADIPVVGGVLGSAHTSSGHDYAWFAPAPSLQAHQPTAAPIVPGGRLVIANLGTSEAQVQLSDALGEKKPSEHSVPAGAAVALKAPKSAVIHSSVPVHAGVRVVREATIDAYPIVGQQQLSQEITVYPR